MNLTAADYEFVQRLLLERSAIRISTDQAYLVKTRLEPIAKQAGLSDLSELVARLRREPFGALHTQVVEAMTTNETSFFRDQHPFQTLKRDVLPELIARKPSERTLNIWSAACSTGQEPYSLAMLLCETPELAHWRIRIMASDLSRNTLLKAQEGVYSSLEVGRGLPARLLTQYFDRVGSAFQVKPRLRNMIEWKQLNLVEHWPTTPKFDLVLMRNVLIYFVPKTSEAVLQNVHKRMHPQGYLILGTTENMLGFHTDFSSVTKGKTVLYRPQKHKG